MPATGAPPQRALAEWACPGAWRHRHGPAEGTAVELPQPWTSLLGDAARS